MTEKAQTLLNDQSQDLLAQLNGRLGQLDDWSEAGIEAAVRAFAEANDVKLGKVAQPLRAALTGSTTSPGIFEVAAVLGKSETLGRIEDAARLGEAA